jgi:hypothetical protein
LPRTLKISVHTGSDKFSLYPVIHRVLGKYGAGLHLKTAGTTWLEEIVGLALSGPSGLDITKRIYATAISRFDELCRPYATVVEIDRAQLPAVPDVSRWTGQELASHLRNDPTNAHYNIHMRQIMHVAFKVAAEMGVPFRSALIASREMTSRLVTDNLFARHVHPLFIGA